MTPLSFAVLALAAVLFAPAVTAQMNCTAAVTKCFQNSDCTMKFNEYNMACAGAYASGQSVNCTSQCNTSLAAAIQLEPSLSTCECTDYTCSIGQRNLVKACYGITVPAKFCADFSADCLGDSACAPVLQNYLSNCGAVLGSGKQADCSDACRMNLNALLTIQPAFRTCPCGGDAMCDGPQKNIQAGCFTCDAIGQYCYDDPMCRPIIDKYTTDCGTLLSGATMTCSKDCLDSTNALIAAEPTFSTCQCPMTNSNCTIEQTRLASCYAMPGSCAHASAVCGTDVACNAALQTYETECGKLFDSGAPADCTTKCRNSLNNLLTVSPSFITCSCAGDAECIKDLTNVEKGCYQGNRFCSKLYGDCQGKPCGAQIDAYVNACAKVSASGAKADCTPDCLSKLTAATQSISGLSTCVCPTADKACVMSQQNFKDAECYDHATQPPTQGVTQPGPTPTDGAERVTAFATWIIATVFFFAY